MRILLWHVHGAWTTAFVSGGHTYLVPVTADRGPDGLGRARTYRWPDNAIGVTPEALGDQEVDVVLLQRPQEWELAERWWVTGTDLLPAFAAVAPLDVYGMRVSQLPAKLGLAGQRLAVHEDPPQNRMHAELVRRRVYLHPHRWTSLGLSLLEAMTCAMPVLVLASTEATLAVPREAGALSTDPAELVEAARWLVHDVDAARRCGAAARAGALARYGLPRFLVEWDALLKEITS